MIVYYTRYSVKPPTLADLTAEQIEALRNIPKKDFRRGVNEAAKKQYKEWLSLTHSNRNRVYIELGIATCCGLIFYFIKDIHDFKWLGSAALAIAILTGVVCLYEIGSQSRTIKSYKIALRNWKAEMFLLKESIDRMQS